MACPTCTGGGKLCQCLMENPDGARVAGQGSESSPYIVDTAEVVIGLRGTVALTTSGIAEATKTYTVGVGEFLNSDGETALRNTAPTLLPPYTAEQIDELQSFDGAPTSNLRAGSVNGIFAVGGTQVRLIFTTPLPNPPRGVAITYIDANAHNRRVYVSSMSVNDVVFFIDVPITGAGSRFSYLIVL